MKQLSIMLTLAVLTGCTSEAPAPQPGGAGSSLSGIMLSSPPAGAEPLLAVKDKAKPGDEVRFKARIGGRGKPFVDGRAMMVVIDPALPSCADNAGDSCPVPWDYCCETQETITNQTATVQFVDDTGKPIAAGLQGHEGLAELDWITVVGKVQQAGDGVFVVNATGIFVEKKFKKS